MKKLIALLLALLMVLSIVGCAKEEAPADDAAADAADAPADDAAADDAADAPADDEYYIAAFAKGYQHQFWVLIREGMESVAAEYNAKLTFEAPDNNDANQQLEQVETALGNGADAIILASVDAVALAQAVDSAAEQGVPAFTFDSDTNSDKVLAFYGTNNYAGGELAGEKMAEKLGGAGKVAIIANDQTSNSIIERRDGFIDYLEANAPDIEVIDIQYSEDDSFKATEIATTYILTYDDLDAIYTCGQSASEGAIPAVKDQGKTGEILLVGFDSGSIMLDAIDSGVLWGAVTQSPYNMGVMAATAACEYIVNGVEPAEYTNDSGSAFYTAENVNDEDIQKMVYQG